MAEHSRYQQGIIRRAYEHKDTIALQRLSEIVSDLYVAEGGKGVKKLWDSARTALVKLVPNDPRVAKVLASRDVSALAKLITELSADARSGKEQVSGEDDAGPVVQEGSLSREPVAPAEAAPEAPEAARPGSHVDTSPPTADECKRAMKAFRKRLKLKRLDDESKLGRSPLSSGKASQTVAIMAPREFRPAVWEELVKQGKLRKSGSFYELLE